jgi:hypothetical protein
MRRHFVLLVLLLALTLVAVPAPAVASPPTQGGLCLPYGCTVFVAANDQVALAGNNEDWKNPFTRLWFIPAGEGTFGQMYIGYDDDLLQGGMNDQGLFFDTLALPLMLEPPQTDLPDVHENVLSVLMSTCADVQCVVDYMNEHDRTLLVSAQIFFGDSSGDAVIVEPIEMIRKSGAFLVSTNFLQSATPPSEIPCERFKTAQAMLTEANGEFSVDLFRQILDATHQEGDYPTVYSNVYDLKAGIMYLYLFYDFEHVVEINLADELALGVHEYDVASLFPENIDQAVFRNVALSNYRMYLKSQGYDPDVDTSAFASYVGRYAVPASLIESGAVSAEYMEITSRDGSLYFDVPGDVIMPVPLYATSPTTFFAASYNVDAIMFSVEFLVDAAGQVSGLQGDFGGTTLVLDRIP